MRHLGMCDRCARGCDALFERGFIIASPDKAELYVMAEDAPELEGLSPAESFRWPADEDRLRMAFMTSA